MARYQPPGRLLVDDPAAKPKQARAKAHTLSGLYGLDPSALKAMQEYLLLHQSGVGQALRSLDALMPSALQQVQLGVAAGFARTLTGASALTGLREAMRAQGELQRVLTSPAWSRLGELKGFETANAYANRLTGLSAAIRAVQELPSNAAIEQASATFRRVERLNTASLTSWRRLTVRPPGVAVDFVRLEAAGRTTFGLASVSAFITRYTGPADVPGKDWLVAPTETRDQLLLRLKDLDEALPAKLHGAWDRASRPGPSAASQAANTLVELIDWSLRLAAPDEAVLDWHVAEHRSPTELHEGRPTRGLKVRFLLRYHGADGVAADTYAKHVAEILKLLQGGKHHLVDEDLTIIRHTIPSVEGLLSFVLLAGTTSLDADPDRTPRNA